MRTNIHPKIADITIEDSQGTHFTTISTYGYGKKGVILKTDTDMHNHKAWKKNLDQSSDLSRKNKRLSKYGSQNILTSFIGNSTINETEVKAKPVETKAAPATPAKKKK